MKQFIQLKLKSKSFGPRQNEQQRPYHVDMCKYYKSLSFENEHISGNIRNLKTIQREYISISYDILVESAFVKISWAQECWKAI